MTHTDGEGGGEGGDGGEISIVVNRTPEFTVYKSDF